jgi:hypothetical protein
VHKLGVISLFGVYVPHYVVSIIVFFNFFFLMFTDIAYQLQ